MTGADLNTHHVNTQRKKAVGYKDQCKLNTHQKEALHYGWNTLSHGEVMMLHFLIDVTNIFIAERQEERLKNNNRDLSMVCAFQRFETE